MKAKAAAIAASVALIVGGAVAGGCGSDGAELGAGDPTPMDEVEMTAHLVARAEMPTRLVSYTSFEEVLPNVSYLIDDAEPVRLTDLVVIGSVVSAEEGRGWKPSEDEAKEVDGVVVGFHDPGAWARMLHLDVEVDEVLGTRDRIPDRIHVGLTIGGDIDPDVVVRGLRALGRVALPLTRSNPVFAYDDDLYAIAEDGALLVRVLDSGRLKLPFKPEASAELLASVPTVDALRAQARAPERELRFTTVDAVPRRVG
jgi:hypothetical protein